MELRSVEELMDLLYACEGTRPPGGRGGPAGLHDHALQTAALLRKSHPADKELQVAGLVHGIGRLLGDDAGHADRAADAVRPLLGERVSRLVRLHAAARRCPATVSPAEAAAFERDPLAADAVTLRQADEAAEVAGMDAGVLEDWRTVLELVASRHARLGAMD
jgi:predicted HD phosphohydrolase